MQSLKTPRTVVHQIKLSSALQQQIDNSNIDFKLSPKGLCNGFTGWFIWTALQGKLEKFKQDLTTISKGQQNPQKSLNYAFRINYLNSTEKFQPTVSPFHVATPFSQNRIDLSLDELKKIKNKNPTNIALSHELYLPVTKAQLKNKLLELFQNNPGKAFLIGSNGHSCGVYVHKDGAKVTFYDSNSHSGPKVLEKPTEQILKRIYYSFIHHWTKRGFNAQDIEQIYKFEVIGFEKLNHPESTAEKTQRVERVAKMRNAIIENQVRGFSDDEFYNWCTKRTYKNYEPLFFLLAEVGNVHLFDRFFCIAEKRIPNGLYQVWISCLTFALKNSRTDLIHWCLQKGYSITDNDSTRLNEFIVKHGDPKVLKTLITKGAFSHPTPTRNYFLTLAIKLGNIEILKVLLEHGKLNPNMPSGPDLNTPLHFAIYKKRVDMVKLLIQHGAFCDVENSKMHSLLSEALSLKQYEIALILVQNGARNEPGVKLDPIFLNHLVQLKNPKCLNRLLKIGTLHEEDIKFILTHFFKMDNKTIFIDLLINLNPRQRKQLRPFLSPFYKVLNSKSPSPTLSDAQLNQMDESKYTQRVLTCFLKKDIPNLQKMITHRPEICFKPLNSDGDNLFHLGVKFDRLALLKYLVFSGLCQPKGLKALLPIAQRYQASHVTKYLTSATPPKFGSRPRS